MISAGSQLPKPSYQPNAESCSKSQMTGIGSVPREPTGYWLLTNFSTFTIATLYPSMPAGMFPSK